MPSVIQYAGASVLYARSIPGFPWHYTPNYDSNVDGNFAGLTFGDSANLPLIANGAGSTGGFAGPNWTTQYMSLNDPAMTPLTASASDFEDYLFASWGNTIVDSQLYSSPFGDRLNYPNDPPLWPGGPYNFVTYVSIGNISNFAFSNNVDNIVYQLNLPLNGAIATPYIVTTKNGFFFNMASYSGKDDRTGNRGPIILYVDPPMATYRRLLVVGDPTDAAATFWLNEFDTLSSTKYTDSFGIVQSPLVKATSMTDGVNLYVGLRSATAAFDPGAFPLLKVTDAFPAFPPRGAIVPIIGFPGTTKSLGPAFLGCCAGSNGMPRLYPTASGTR